MQEHKPLWDMPALYLAIVGLVSAEWALPQAAGARVRAALPRTLLVALAALGRAGAATPPREESHLVIVVGLGGEPKYTRRLPRAGGHP